MNAALEIARGGRDVMVVESGYPGYGCSTRNGGQISTHVKPSLEKLTQKVGASQASAMRQEGVNALDWIEELITKEKLCLLYTSPSPRDGLLSRMPSSA